MKPIGTKTLILSVVLALSLNSCKKETIDPVKNNPPITGSTPKANPGNQLKAVTGFNNIALASLKSILGTGGKTFKTDENETCATVTVDSSALPYHVSIDFAGGCTERDHTRKKGLIQIEHNNKDIKVAGAYGKVTLTDYQVWRYSNGVEEKETYNGTVEIENLGVNGNGNTVISFKVNGIQRNELTATNSTVIATAEFEFIAGFDTEDETDDIISITGDFQANIDGNANLTTLTIMSPLIANQTPDCRDHITLGELRVKEDGFSDRYINYGDGTCDDVAIETVDGVPTEIKLQGNFY